MERAVLVLAPTGKDASLICSVLTSAGLGAQACADVRDAVDRAHGGIGALVIAEEALAPNGALRQLAGLLQRQPPWSDLPVLLLTRKGRSLLTAQVVEELGNVTLVERPTQIGILVRAARTALRNRDHQYDVREEGRRKDEFLAMLAHELRNPLAPIANVAHLLRSAGLQEPKLKLAVGVLQRQTRQLSRLVDDLLDVARISQGKIHLQLGRHDLRQLVSAGIETSLPQIDAMGHQVDVLLPDAPLWVEADAVRISQCVANLVGNAAKYTPPKGSIGVHLDDDGGQARLRVIDNGIGFDASMAERLFELFAQVDSAQGHSQGGLGLGLAIVRSLVEMHRGSVSASSDGPNRGARFEIRLPLSDAASALRPGVPPPQPLRGSRACAVLIVDDNEDAADSLAEILRNLGHEVRTAYTGSAALSALALWTPDVAILDIGLPDMSGYQLAQALRGRGQVRCLLALSGWGQPGDKERSRQAGFDHHLTKPADLQQLLAIIRDVADVRS